jgi:hypothetical protein
VASSFQSILILAFFTDMAIMLVVGGRLLFAASRTRRAPEAAIGASAAFGALGVILGLVATSVLERDPAAFPIWAAGRVVSAIGVGGLAIGCWRIYRPEATWPAATSAVICAIAATGCALRTFPGSIAPPADASLGAFIGATASLAAFGWATAEAFRYHHQLKRRLALGLAKPLVTRQFRLWGVSGVCAFGSSATSAFVLFALGRDLPAFPVVFAAVQIALFYAAVCLWFAFFPPGFYRRRVARPTPA